jgi:hypothetical protein
MKWRAKTHSPLREAHSLLEQLFYRQAGVVVGMPWTKWTRTETGPSTGSLLQPRLGLVLFDSRVLSVVPALRE